MKCPCCPDAVLAMTVRDDVEIDYCTICRGVWLDRGELDKIIERAARTPPSAALQEREGSSSYHRRGGRRRGSWLSELFD